MWRTQRHTIRIPYPPTKYLLSLASHFVCYSKVNEDNTILSQIKKRKKEAKELKNGMPTPPSPPCPPGMLAFKLQEVEHEAKIARALLEALSSTCVWEILPATAEESPSCPLVYAVAASVLSWIQSIKRADVANWGIQTMIISIEVGFARCLGQARDPPVESRTDYPMWDRALIVKTQRTIPDITRSLIPFSSSSPGERSASRPGHHKARKATNSRLLVLCSEFRPDVHGSSYYGVSTPAVYCGPWDELGRGFCLTAYSQSCSTDLSLISEGRHASKCSILPSHRHHPT